MKKVLIVDDNDFYFGIMQEIYERNGYLVDRANTASEGWNKFQHGGLDYYQLIVTDITMESQISGLVLWYKLKRSGFRNPIYFASTGFNIKLNYFISGGLLKLLGIQRIIPKNNFHEMEALTLQRFFI